MDLGAWGVDAGYWDVSGHWHEPPPATLEAVGAAVGATDGDGPPPGPPLWFVRAGTVEYLQGPADLVLEDGTTLRATDALPPDLAPGYHRLVPLDGGPVTRLIVTPGRCHLSHDLRTWGWSAQLYAARSTESWGIGDLADLRRLGTWAAAQGAGILAVSPLHAPGPAGIPEPSPYYPSSRRFRNPLHLRIEEVPGATSLGSDLETLAKEGRALNDDRRIDRARVWELKRAALQTVFAATANDPEIDRYREAHHPELLAWATYCAIADEHGNDWRTWPVDLRHPTAPAVAAYADAHAAAVRFHVWVQWAIDRQLAAASAPVPLLQDLAVGFDPGGADAWSFQDTLALDMRVGAPPDDFNVEGQDWGLPPFVPWKLRTAAYEPFIQTVRSAFAHSGGLRVDHVMGLFRLFWVPPDSGPAAGTYVRYPAGELLDILALESYRAGSFVVGEDLGTVEDSVRAELHERQVLSYRLLWFEHGAPATWPGQAVGAVTTHDLPTVAGLWTGADPAAAEMAPVRERLQRVTGAPDDAPVDDVIVATHRALGTAHSRVLLATLDDAMAVTERPNRPGTVDETNWSLALPLPIEDLEDDPRAAAIGEALSRRP